MALYIDGVEVLESPVFIGNLTALNAAGPALVDEAATTTNPTLIPNRAELDTGIGWASDKIYIVLGGADEYHFGTAEADWNGNNLTNVGHIGLGNQPDSAIDILYADETYTITDNVDKRGLYAITKGQKTSAAFTARLQGIRGEVVVTATNAQPWSNAVGLQGVYGYVRTITGTADEKDVTGAASFYADASLAEGVNDIKIVDLYGLYVEARTLVANSKVTNCTGVFIGAQAGGATLNYAVHSAGGLIKQEDTANSTSATTGSIHTAGGIGIAENLYCAKAINTPDGMGGDGEQLTSGGDNVAMDWAAAGSLLKFKDVRGILSPQDALDSILHTQALLFKYRKETLDGEHAITTGDYETVYAGVLAEDAPWVMHYSGKIFSPVSAFGYTVAAIQALQSENEGLKTRLVGLEAQLSN